MKDTALVKILILINLVLISCISVLIYSFTTKEKPEISHEVLGAQETIVEKPEDFTVSVCDTQSCVNISSMGLVENSIVDENAIYQKVLDMVIPYFEQKYGGKLIESNSKGTFIYWKEDIRPELSNIFEEILNAFKQGKSSAIYIDIKDLPSTDGRYSYKYIEIDNSRQKLYVWINGKVEKEILLSAAKDGYEVYGVFPIVDKGVAPISPSGSYMPYWMAFYYSKSQDSWYGLHSLIWWYDENGKKIYEPNSNIGIRRSRGCIRMVLEDAKYLYDIFEKGDHILIHE